MEPDDAALVARSAAGDQAAFAELIRRHEQPLAALVRHLVSNRADAEDLLQETLVQAWVGIGRIREPGKVRAWLLQVARNRCRDFWKSAQRRDCPTEAEEIEAHANRYGRAAPGGGRAADVLDALDAVAPAEREAARLFYLEGFTIAQIAERSHRPQGTVKRWLYSAREQMRGILDAPPEGE